MSTFQERYTPKVVGVNTTVDLTDDSVGGFLCATAGTVTLVAGSTTLLNAFAVEAGVYYPIPVYLGNAPNSFTTAGGASGLLMV